MSGGANLNASTHSYPGYGAKPSTADAVGRYSMHGRGRVDTLNDAGRYSPLAGGAGYENPNN